MRERLILWCLRRLLAIEHPAKATRKSDRERMVAFDEAFKATGFQDILRATVSQHVRTIALRSANEQEVWFNRGSIFACQTLLQNMSRYHKMWEKEKLSEKK